VDCTAKSNNGDGIRSFDPSVTVSGCTAHLNLDAGINVGIGGIISDCTSSGNTTGFQVGDHGTVTGCSAVRNSGRGIYLKDGCEVRGCVASTNVTTGIYGGDNCLIKDCTVTKNGSGGILVINYCQVSGCMISRNTGTRAVDINTGSQITDCVVSQNSEIGINTQNRCVVRACHVNNNGRDGIDITADCTVVNNECNENNPLNISVDGLFVIGDRNTIDGNVMRGNGGYGIRASTVSFNVITRNSAKGNATGSYLIGGGNDVGPIGTAALSTSPWANLQ
jgi:parallel beta-helix repeat protein